MDNMLTLIGEEEHTRLVGIGTGILFLKPTGSDTWAYFLAMDGWVGVV